MPTGAWRRTLVPSVGSSRGLAIDSAFGRSGTPATGLRFQTGATLAIKRARTPETLTSLAMRKTPRTLGRSALAAFQADVPLGGTEGGEFEGAAITVATILR